MKYYGIVPTSSIPSKCVYKEWHHSEKHAGKTVEYWEIWVSDLDELKPLFKDDDEPNKNKIKAIENALGIKFKK